MAQTQIPLDLAISILFKILSATAGLVVLLCTAIAGVMKMMHTDVKKAIYEIHTDLKPMKEDVITLKNEVKNIKENHDDLKDRVTEHGKEISILKKYLPRDKSN